MPTAPFQLSKANKKCQSFDIWSCFISNLSREKKFEITRIILSAINLNHLQKPKYLFMR